MKGKGAGTGCGVIHYGTNVRMVEASSCCLEYSVVFLSVEYIYIQSLLHPGNGHSLNLLKFDAQLIGQF